MGREGESEEERKARKAAKKEKKDKKEPKDKKDKKDKREKDKSTSQVSGKHIGADDYFVYNDHFRAWLKLANEGDFEALNTEDARAKFENEFVKLYNSNRLSAIFYSYGDSMPPDVVEALGIKKSSHAWSFAKKMTDGDKDELTKISEEISSNSGSNDAALWRKRNQRSKMAEEHGFMKKPGNYGRGDNNMDNEYGRRDQKRERAVQRERIEEIAPRHDPGSRDAMMDKRRQVSSMTHASSIAKEEQASGMAMNEDFLIGNYQEDSFEAIKARLDRQQQQKEARKRQRTDKRMAESSLAAASSTSWMDKLGVDLGAGKISIAPRADAEATYTLQK